MIPFKLIKSPPLPVQFSLLLINLQFASCVYYIISREQLIKKTLGSCFLNEGALDNPLYPDSITLSSNKVIPVSGKRKNVSRDNQLRSCAVLLEVVSTLQQLVDKINWYFGKQLVMNLMSAFVCITVQLHYTIRLIRQAEPPEGSDLTITFNSTLIALHTLEILVIFAAGDRAKVKWAELITEVQRMRQLITDEEVRVQLFDVINTMCYKRLEFHGCNLFTIDLSVITGVSGDRRRGVINLNNNPCIPFQLISSVATYLIVLVQFQMNEENSGDYDAKKDGAKFSVEA